VLEALRQAPARLQHPGADERARGVAGVPHALGERGLRVVQEETPLSRTPWRGGAAR
jgi:hypothetical protein